MQDWHPIKLSVMCFRVFLFALIVKREKEFKHCGSSVLSDLGLCEVSGSNSESEIENILKPCPNVSKPCV